MPWTKEEAKRRLRFNHRDVEQMRSNLEKFDADPDKETRLSECECRTCYYLRRERLAGHAFTMYRCSHCGEEKRHPNTAVPVICPECARKIQVCTVCGADLDEDAAAVPETPKPTYADYNALSFLVEYFGLHVFSSDDCAAAVKKEVRWKKPGVSDLKGVWEKRLANLARLGWIRRKGIHWTVSDLGRTVFIEAIVFNRKETLVPHPVDE